MMYGKKSPSSKRIKSNPADEKWIELNLSFNVCVKSVAPESRKKMKKNLLGKYFEPKMRGPTVTLF